MQRFLALVVACLSVTLFQGCLVLENPLGLPPSSYQEVIVKSGSADKILLLDIDGVISSGAGESNPLFGRSDSTVNQIADKLAKAKRDKKIKAIILRVDSPGGGVTASDVVYHSLKNYREKSGNPIYVSMLDLAASGGYYISMAGEELYVHPTSITGSIGVIAMFPQFEDLGQKIGVYVEVVKSGKNKDLTGGFRNMTPEQREILQSMIDEMYGRFVTVVKEGRPKLSEETIRELADGRIYTADQAVNNGLVDGVKYLDEVIDRAREGTGSPKARVVMYRKTSATKYDSVYAKSDPLPTAERGAGTTTNVSLLHLDATALAPAYRPVFNYLWIP